MALVSFPYDFVYGWKAKYNIELPKEAEKELIDTLETVANESYERIPA